MTTAGRASRGTVLELLHDALSDVVTLQAEYRDWARPAPSLSLVLDAGAEAYGDEARPRTVRWQGDGPFPRATQTRRRIWLQAPYRVRVEIERNGHVARRGIRDGTRWWRWIEALGADRGDLAADGRSIPPLVDPPLLTPARLLGSLRLDSVSSGQRAGREVLTARATLRDRCRAHGETHFELEFDAEHGTMLRSAAYVDHQCVQLTEATEIAYGRELDPELFAWPPSGNVDTPSLTADASRVPGLLPPVPPGRTTSDRVDRG